MIDIRKLTLVGLLAVSTLSTVACSSSDDKTGTGGGGGSGSGTVAPGALITDFSGPTAFFSGNPYKGAGAGWAEPAFTTTGSLHFTLTSGASTAMYAYAYVGVPLDNSPVNATAAAGVTFKASGTLTGTGCQIQYSTVDQDHSEKQFGGNCETTDMCYPSSKVFPLAASPTDVTVLWADQAGGKAAGTAISTVNAAQILNLQWQVQTSTGAISDSCTADVTIDDIKWQ
jgi:hypothetical protein